MTQIEKINTAIDYTLRYIHSTSPASFNSILSELQDQVPFPISEDFAKMVVQILEDEDVINSDKMYYDGEFSGTPTISMNFGD